MSAIEVENLRKTYAGGVEALRGLSFEVERGTVFALLGPNGAGKSTAVRILTTLSEADAGRARVVGLDVGRDAAAVRRRIGYVAQESGVDELATGRENLLLQGRIYRYPASSLAERVEELLEVFGLVEAADRLVKTYSGGMKRRLDLAMGLVHRPEVLMLDEPTTGLDPESRAVMWREIRELCERGLTILLTTHYLEEADRLASRVAIVDHGVVVAAGSPEDLKGSLRGDLVVVELQDAGQGEIAREALLELDAVLEVLIDEGVVYATVGTGARAMAPVAAALERAGVSASELTLSRPSLDDVYLHHTGHAYRQEGEEADVDDAGAMPALGPGSG